jgi:hypothetical protein
MPLDPRQCLEVLFRQDLERNYILSYFAAAAEFGEGFEKPPKLSTLDKRGWDVIKILDNPQDYLDYPDSAEDMGEDRCLALLDRIFTDKLTDMIQRRFWSEFMPISIRIARDARKDKPGTSHKWHFDTGPQTHLKLLLYLNETDGGTMVINRHESDLLARGGYAYTTEDSRVNDIEKVTRKMGIKTPKQTLVTPKPGSGILFEPSLVAHKGVKTSKGVRNLIQVLIIPFSVPWRNNWPQGWDLIRRNDNAGFPHMRAG